MLPPAARANYLAQPGCGEGLGGGESLGLDAEVDALPASVAADMTAFMTADELAAYVAGLEIAAVKFAGTAVGDEMAALLGYLK